jgi:hypothetical protein
LDDGFDRVSFVSDTVPADTGLQQLVVLKLSEAKHEIQRAIYSLNDCLVGEQHRLPPFVSATDPLEEETNSNGVESNGTTDLTKNQQERCPTPTEVVIGNPVSNSSHRGERKVHGFHVVIYVHGTESESRNRTIRIELLLFSQPVDSVINTREYKDNGRISQK